MAADPSLGMWLLAAGVWDALVLSAAQRRWLALVVAAYGSVIASVLGASFGVRGLGGARAARAARG